MENDEPFVPLMDMVFTAPAPRDPAASHDHAVRVDNQDAVIPHLVGTCARCTMLDGSR